MRKPGNIHRRRRGLWRVFLPAIPWLILAIVVLLWGLAIGDDGARAGTSASRASSGPATRAVLSWDSARMAELEKEARGRLPDGFVPTKSNFQKPNELMRDVLRERLSAREMEELVDSLATLPYEEGRHASFIAECLLVLFQQDDNRAMLVKLLSVNCPREISIHWDIEFWLAPNDPTKGENVFALFQEAFEKSQRAEAKRVIADACRRALGGHGIADPDDAAVIKKSVDWFEKNQKRLELNYRYHDNSWDSYAAKPEEVEKIYANNPLFKLNDGGRK